MVALLALVTSPAAAAPSGTPAASPADSKAAAQAKLVDGVELLKTRDYRDALERFQEAYGLVPSPLIFYDYGLAYVGLGDAPRALESFDRFLAEARDAPDDKRRRAEDHRADLRGRVSIVALQADVETADLVVDGGGPAPGPFPRRLYLYPGAHQLLATTGGATWSQAITCTGGQTIDLTLHLAPPAPAKIAAPPTSIPPAPMQAVNPPQPVAVLQRPTESTSWARPWVWPAAAAGAVSLGVGIAYGLAARNDGEAVTSDSQARRDFRPELQSAGLHDERMEAIFLTVGAVAVAAAVGLYAWARYHAGHGGSPAEGAP